MGEKVRCERVVRVTIGSVFNHDLVRNAASRPHSGLMSDTRVSTVVYPIGYVLVDGTCNREELA